ncbi:acyl-CoA N-acyltransferase [Aspergillus bertholletiae]|uniref:Acyl-CoA N-acyltransferase n=1 Tax=Aspergillus bertholletiae TaxID=1226010 RepID=A0A5N7B1Z5_9EURO|nr:acyl-CoA N-acyltransferase [Aspergillus bertholletiae]
MPIEIRYATESDSPELVHINTTSFSPGVFYQNAFANVELSALQALKYARTFARFVDPKYHLLVATDSETGRVIAFMRVVIPLHYQQDSHSFTKLSEDASKMAAEPDNYLPDGINQRVYSCYLDMLKSVREKYLEKNDMVLDFLATDPNYQGKGIGSQLLKWATQKADTMNARLFLEATEEGYPLYKKYGWNLVEEIVLDFEPLGGHSKGSYYVMIRDPIPPTN